MPTCPNCKVSNKRRKSGNCPECGVRLESYRTRGKNKETIWVYESVDTVALVRILESLIRTTGLIEFEFQNMLPELAMARTLYEKCGYDQSLAGEVIFCFFDPEISRSMIWTRNPKSMATVIWDNINERGSKGCFSVALAIAKERVQKRYYSMKQEVLHV